MQRTCSAGHVYDADQFPSCPYCNRNTRAIQFGATAAPAGYGATTAPAGYGAAHAGRNDTIGQTVMPEAIRRRMEQERDNRTVGEFKRKLGYEPVVGWLVCIEGPMRGVDFRLHDGYNFIGREEGDVHIHGDNAISRQKHAVVAFYSKRNSFHVGPADGRNIIELNDEPVFNHVQMENYDVITVGNTKLMLVGMCGDRFNWTDGVKHE